MRIFALLCWYDEPAGQLAETTASLAKMCDHVIACDGAYLSFPGALSHPVSGPEQSEVIFRTAMGIGMGVTIHVPEGPWEDEEVGKRGYMLDLLATVAEPGDWFLVIDGDEVLSGAPPNAREVLAGLEEGSADLVRWERYVPEVLEVAPVTKGQESMRRLYRFEPPMRLAGTHFAYEADGRPVWQEPGAYLPEIRLEHRPRPAVRMRQKADYRNRVTVYETPDLTEARP
jgi:hypothetical protein